MNASHIHKYTKIYVYILWPITKNNDDHQKFAHLHSLSLFFVRFFHLYDEESDRVGKSQ